MTVDDCLAGLASLAPLELAEDWDNVGLLLGDRTAPVARVLTCLTVTPDVVAEAVAERAHLIVTHHPVLFRPVQRLTADDPDSAALLWLMAAGIAVYSPHTAYDSAAEGINQQLAEALELTEIQPLRPAVAGAHSAAAGGGRQGRLARPLVLRELMERVRSRLNARGIQYVGDPDRRVSRIAIACGSAAEYLSDARRTGCEVLVTGEARFHACLEARTRGIALILPGHYATERPAVETLARRLAEQFPELTVWASRAESDPLQWDL